MSKMFGLFLLFLITTVSTIRAEVPCYVCAWSESDTSCLDNVESAEKVTCPNYCGVTRVDDINANKMTAFARVCIGSDTISYTEHGGRSSVVQSCDTELCNIMDGRGVCR